MWIELEAGSYTNFAALDRIIVNSNRVILCYTNDLTQTIKQSDQPVLYDRIKTLIEKLSTH